MSKRKVVESVRPSRDGHEFHEAWAARKCLELLLPKDELLAIAVEGVAPKDGESANDHTMEVADLTIYYGSAPLFKDAMRVEMIQFKYSFASEDLDYQPSDAKKTIQKFSKSFSDFVDAYGLDVVTNKLSFEIVTNQRISLEFLNALTILRDGKTKTSGQTLKFCNQIKRYLNLSDQKIIMFTRALRVRGTGGNLDDAKLAVKRVITDWSVQSIDARARLGDLKQLVRDKAGMAGQNKNLILKEDILTVLDLPDVDALFPSKEAFPDVKVVLDREQLNDAIQKIEKTTKPFAIVGGGGIGKTVFMQTIASKLSEKNIVVLFDCFGGGSYRAVNDSRHLIKRGLFHIVNHLAARGLCDLLLPGSGSISEWMTSILKRIEQTCIQLKKIGDGSKLVIMLDAIDNANVRAEQLGEESFPKLLLESIHTKDGIPNLILVVSSRDHRLEKAKGFADVESFPLSPFSKKETGLFLTSHDSSITLENIEVAFSRSDGNARILERLVNGNRNQLEQSLANHKVSVNDFIGELINASLMQGYDSASINAFLAGLAVLPLPIPIRDYAVCSGIREDEIESFASDLSPMLERTAYGIMFRDEPTDTFIIENYGADIQSVRKLTKNLSLQQENSVYAAKALPQLLSKLGDVNGLMALAFSEEFPSSITSKVGKQSIRVFRIMAAMSEAIKSKNEDGLVSLTFELATIASMNDRGEEYILANPDLVIASSDVDSKRRLFELKTKWQGTRHSRLSIAHLLAGEVGDAYDHAKKLNGWINHYIRNYSEDRSHQTPHPDAGDISAVCLSSLAQGNYKDAYARIRGWNIGFAYRMAAETFRTVDTGNQIDASRFDLESIIGGVPESVPICCALISELRFNKVLNKTRLIDVLRKLSRAAKKVVLGNKEKYDSLHDSPFIHGVLYASTVAVILKRNSEAKAILKLLTQERPSTWSFSSISMDESVGKYLQILCLSRIIERKKIKVIDLLPKEIYAIIPKRLRITKSGLKEQLLKIIQIDYQRLATIKDRDSTYDYENRREKEEFVSKRLLELVELAQSYCDLIQVQNYNKALASFIKLWDSTRGAHDDYRNGKARFVDPIFKKLLRVVMSVRIDLNRPVGEAIVRTVSEKYVTSLYAVIEIVSIFSRYDFLRDLAGELAVYAYREIEFESDIPSRTSYYAALARAILPASRLESALYFKKGIDQSDMIGSGDYWFTNELMVFSSAVSEELSDQNFHALTNICELNLSDEPHKFPWYAFGTGAAKVGGRKALSKISRWHDRKKVELDYTLLPTVIGLVKARKLDPVYGLALMELCSSAETWDWDFTTLIEEIFKIDRSKGSDLLLEVLRKFEHEHPKTVSEQQTIRLLGIIEPILGADSSEVKRLKKVIELSKETRDDSNRKSNLNNRSYNAKVNKHSNHKEILGKVNPGEFAELDDAFKRLESQDHLFQTDIEIAFDFVRLKVNYSEREKYIRNVSELTGIRFHSKLVELENCFKSWSSSSVGLGAVFKEVGRSIVERHAKDLISLGINMDHLQEGDLNRISKFSDESFNNILIVLVNNLVVQKIETAGSIWLAIATHFCRQTDGKSGNVALTRLLESETAKLSDSVLDGPYKTNLYQSKAEEEDVADFIWMCLGSPDERERWRAAHAVRFLARQKKWNVIGILISSLERKSASSFQAPELPFFYLNAKLWLLFALQRISIDDAKSLASNRHVFENIVNNERHVVMQKMASLILTNILRQSNKSEEKKQIDALKNVGVSSIPKYNGSLRDVHGFEWDRPKNRPEHSPRFSLDMDFEKYFVEPLSDVFGKAHWEVGDSVIKYIRSFDGTIKSMYESGGRKDSYNGDSNDARVQRYGYYLGWHSICYTANEFLKKYPITDDSYHGDPWGSWLSEFLVTRKDFLWLSDGTDNYPIEARGNLLEIKRKRIVITGESEKILKLVGVEDLALGKFIGINGYWKSLDGLDVHVTSALAEPKLSNSIIHDLLKTEPIRARLLSYQYNDDDDNEYIREKNIKYVPWIVSPTSEAHLDKSDPYCTKNANSRPRFSTEINDLMSLLTRDAFGKFYLNENGVIVSISETWGRYAQGYDDNVEHFQLKCSKAFLKKLLTKVDRDLIVLINIGRFEKEERYSKKESQHSNTTSIIKINKKLEVEYFPGPINLKLKPPKYRKFESRNRKNNRKRQKKL